jgi:sugar transferase (PEP-CTERM system associated)
LILTCILLTAWRSLYNNIFRIAVPPRKVLLIGSGKKALDIFNLLKKHPDYRVVGYVSQSPGKNPQPELVHVGNNEEIEKVTGNYQINDIIVTLDVIKNKQLNTALVNCKLTGINIYDAPAFYENFLQKLPISDIRPHWLLYSNGFDKTGSKFYRRLKRLTDIVIASILLILLFPIYVMICLAIKLDSKGPFFYKQERLGENFKPFILLKFRTMINEAEKGMPIWAEKNDPRVTRVGKFLRKIRLDEIPQLINVLKGEMSLIGPRPEREYFTKKLSKKIPYYSLRFSVRPGLTGWAQVNYKYGDSEKDAFIKTEYDLYYIKSMSPFLDLRILLKTIRIVLFGMGR